MRRSIAVIKENVYESVAQGSLVRKEKKRSSRSELEIVKTQEKFGTKHQRPCALCEQSFSEVNLVLAVPFKVCAYSTLTGHPGRQPLLRPICVQPLESSARDFCIFLHRHHHSTTPTLRPRFDELRLL